MNRPQLLRIIQAGEGPHVRVLDRGDEAVVRVEVGLDEFKEALRTMYHFTSDHGMERGDDPDLTGTNWPDHVKTLQEISKQSAVAASTLARRMRNLVQTVKIAEKALEKPGLPWRYFTFSNDDGFLVGGAYVRLPVRSRYTPINEPTVQQLVEKLQAVLPKTRLGR